MSKAERDRDYKVRRFLSDTYGRVQYALLTGPHTITNIPQRRLPFLIATILLHHAGGLTKAIATLQEADDAMKRVEGQTDERSQPD